jgi:hypothetical protein
VAVSPTAVKRIQLLVPFVDLLARVSFLFVPLPRNSEFSSLILIAFRYVFFQIELAAYSYE